MWSSRSEPSPSGGGGRSTREALRRLRFEPVDEYRCLTVLAGMLVIGVALLAVVGIPSADLHGPLHYRGIMDPFCGATRAMYLTAHGDLREAMRYNPGAPILLVGAGIVVLRAAVGAVSGRWLTVAFPRRIAAALLAVALVVLEINQQSDAALLTSRWTG